MEQTAQVPSGQCGREESHASFNDLENSVPPEESNDELLDQAWDDQSFFGHEESQRGQAA